MLSLLGHSGEPSVKEREAGHERKSYHCGLFCGADLWCVPSAAF